MHCGKCHWQCLTSGDGSSQVSYHSSIHSLFHAIFTQDFDNSLIGQSVTQGLIPRIPSRGQNHMDSRPCRQLPKWCRRSRQRRSSRSTAGLQLPVRSSLICSEPSFLTYRVICAVNAGATAHLNTAVSTVNTSYDGTWHRRHRVWRRN